MKHYSKNIISIFSFSLFISLYIVSPHYASAYYIHFSDATYTNGSHTETFPLHCGDIVQLPPGGTITFLVSATSDIMNYNELCIQSLPEGAAFQCVSGPGPTVSSVFTWTPSGPFSGSVVFVATPEFQDCSLYFDWPLPVELSSFTYSINGNDVILNWQTVSENNNSEFVIERADIVSGNIQNWIQAGSVRGNGTVSTLSYYAFTDKGLKSGLYQFRLKQIDYNGNFEYYYLGSNVQIGEPVRFEVSQNYPNPFNPTTIINYNLTNADHVSLKVYNSSGTEVKTIVDEFKNAGYYSVIFDGKNLASGIYYYKLLSKNFVSVKKMILLK